MSRINDRAKKIMAMRDAGQKFTAIGKEFGISSGRIAQIYHHSKYLLAHAGYPLMELSVRAANVLNNYNLETKDQVIAAIHAGKLKPGQGGPRNYGHVTHQEVCKWAGVTIQNSLKKKHYPKFCPHCGHRLTKI